MRGAADDGPMPAPGAEGRRAALRAAVSDPETVRAVGLALATLSANGLALVFTVVFARLLGADGYGSMSALISTALILFVPGTAMQVAAARETARGTLGEGPRLSATVERWMARLVLAFLATCALGAALNKPLADAIGVPEHWAAAATLPTGALWLALSIERGVLQGLHAYRVVGLSVVLEASGRLVLGLILFAVGPDVTGAYLGAPASMLLAAVVLAVILRRRLGAPDMSESRHRLRALVAGGWAPVVGLTLVAVLQNIDVIMVKRRIGGDLAGSYAAAAVAAKLVIWVAIGISLYLVPETARRASTGTSTRGVLLRALAVISLVAGPMLLVYLVAPKLLLESAFGPDLTDGSSALLVLGAAMSALAVALLAVQYMLALHRWSFLPLLAVLAVAEPVALALAPKDLVDIATIVLAVQLVACAGAIALALRGPPPKAVSVPPGAG